jgi:hypothetical protein
MPTDLTVILEHRPGELARLGEIAGEAGVTIHGLAAFTGEGRGVVHMLLDDEAVAGCRAALERAGMGIADTREVFVIDVEDRPAALGELTRRLAEANVNVDLAYTTFTGGKIVIATDDVGSARSVLRAKADTVCHVPDGADGGVCGCERTIGRAASAGSFHRTAAPSISSRRMCCLPASWGPLGGMPARSSKGTAPQGAAV